MNTKFEHKEDAVLDTKLNKAIKSLGISIGGVLLVTIGQFLLSLDLTPEQAIIATAAGSWIINSGRLLLTKTNIHEA